MARTRSLSTICTHMRWSLLGAFFCVILDVIIWVITAEFLQGLELTYNKPFFISYVTHSGYIIYLFIWLIWRYFPGNWSCQSAQEGIYSWKYFIFLSFFLTLLLFGFNYTWYLSLPRTTVAANTAIYQSAAAIVFLLSFIILRERVTILKIFCVVISISGVGLITAFPHISYNQSINITINQSSLINQTNSSNKEISNAITPSLLGYFLVIISTVLYSIYEVIYKKLASSPKDTASIQNSIRMMGLIGSYYMIIFGPCVIIAHFTGYEKFQMPDKYEALIIILNAVLDGVDSTLILIGIILSSPLFMSIGVILALPSTMIADFIVHDFILNRFQILGSCFVLLGFSGLCLSQYFHAKTEKNEENTKKTTKDSFNRQQLGWTFKHYMLLYTIGWYPAMVKLKEEYKLLNECSEDSM